MAVETKTGRSNKFATANWSAKSRPHGEPAGWSKPQQATRTQDVDEDLVFPPLSEPPVRWPRVFPGI